MRLLVVLVGLAVLGCRLLPSSGAGAFTVPSPPAFTVSDITLAPEGGWVWFVSRKAIRNDTETIVGYLAESDVKAVRITNATGAVAQTSTLYNNFLDDDHEPPSFEVRSDGVILAAFAYHLGEIYVGIGPSAGVLPAQAQVTNITAQTGLPISVGAYGFTYATIVYSEAEDRYYIFFRYHNEDLEAYLGYTYSDDDGATWETAVLVCRVTYHHLVTNGTDRIDFALSDHPQHGEGDDGVTNTSVYHMYFEGGDWFQSDGTEITASQPFGLADMTKVYDGSTTRAWVWDIAIDGGNPRIAYATFPGNDGDEHTYNRAHWTGSAWVNHEIIEGGTYIPTEAVGANPVEAFYSGGVALDHQDPDVAYVSIGTGSDRWDIHRAVTSDNGASWSLTQLTSSGKQVRPISVIDAADELQVVWMSGNYDSYTDYSVGIGGAGTP